MEIRLTFIPVNSLDPGTLYHWAANKSREFLSYRDQHVESCSVGSVGESSNDRNHRNTGRKASSESDEGCVRSQQARALRSSALLQGSIHETKWCRHRCLTRIKRGTVEATDKERAPKASNAWIIRETSKST
jgi:hypothetical protein